MPTSSGSKSADPSKHGLGDSEGVQFFVRLMLTYAVWKVFFYAAHREDWPLYTPWHDLVTAIGSLYAGGVARFMSGFEGHVTAHGTTVILYGGRFTIDVAEHCLALPAMFVFAMTILLFRGIWWQKLVFISLGWLGIIFINSVRVFFVAEAFMRLSRYYADLHHSFIYVVVTYGFILMMIHLWMKKQEAAEA
jgi:exosortase/archaeosortase family protein